MPERYRRLWGQPMYKLVIVEDERDVRRRVAGLIEKAKSRFQIISEYENGIDAYDGIISDNPDLILTDIKIPYIDGIELVKKVREVLPLVKVIIITGYNEFDYAKRAANLGVVGFISKPVILEDVRALLQKAESVLDEEFVTAESLNRLESFYESSLPIIRENALYRLSNMSDVSPAFEKRLKHNDIDLDYRYFALCVFDFDEAARDDIERYDLAFSHVRKLAGESFAGFCGIDLFNRYDKLCMIIKSNNGLDIKQIEKQLELIIQRAGRYSDMPLSAGISGVHENSRSFALMLKEAMRALGYRGVMGGSKVFSHAVSADASMPVMDDKAVKELGYLMHFKDERECLDCLEGIKNRLERPEAENSYFYALTSILNVLIKACDDLEGLFMKYGGQDGMYRRLFEIKTADEMFEHFRELIKVIRFLNDNVIADSMQSNLRKVVSYMEANFCDPDISFESMARQVGFSVSYIGALLKKNLNTSFVKMLTGMRMEKAQELLADPRLKIIDVAEQVGYSDSYYFSHCFKKYMGVSPKEFRQNE